MKNIILTISIFLIAFTMQSQEKQQEVKKDKNAKVVMNVDGICGMCKKRIETAALKTKGVKFAIWSTKTHQLNLIIDERKTDVSAIQKNILAVGNDILLGEGKNLESKLPVIKHDIAQWKRRHLTPVGKICIVKALILSKLVHLFMALPKPSTKQLQQVQSILFEFIWGNKRDKVKRTKLIQHYSRDGLKMVNIDAFIDSLKFALLRRVTKSKDSAF